MSLRFFSDQCVPAEITDTLRRHAHQTTVLREVLPIRSPDPVVLSHSAKDKAVVRDVAERLRKDGVKVWFDEWEIRPGDSVESPQSKTAKIEEGLERSRVLVLWMSANAFGSDWAQLESGTFRLV